MKLREWGGRFGPVAFNMSATEIYELQRVLQVDARAAAAGLKAGRPGPGGGADATPFNVAFIMLGILLNGSRTNLVERVWSTWHAPHEGTNKSGWISPDTDQMDPPPHFARCALTDHHLFGEALKALLSDPTKAEQVERIEVSRDIEEASIYFRHGAETKRSRFIEEYHRGELDRVDAFGTMRVTAQMGGRIIAMIARELHASGTEA